MVFGKGQVGVNIYPNPAKDIVNIECANAKEILIIDYLGKVIKQQEVNNEKVSLNVNGLTKGVYIAKITQHNEQSITKTFLIE